jgi:hypothetical protein
MTREQADSMERLFPDFDELGVEMAALRMKCVVNSVRKVVDHNGDISQEEIALMAVYGPDGSVNREWSKWTPSASLTFSVSNPGAFDKVLPGKFYYVDLVETTKDDPVT